MVFLGSETVFLETNFIKNDTQIVSLYIVLQIPVNKVSQSTDSSVCYILTISKVDKDNHSWLIPEFSSCSSDLDLRMMIQKMRNDSFSD